MTNYSKNRKILFHENCWWCLVLCFASAEVKYKSSAANRTFHR